jgi:NAD(P)-dependent dehydrogenase (short-subunit alcohol dehydrogenase family)
MSEPTRFPLRGATVAITGGAHGIGLATARAFIDAGSFVCIGDIDEKAAKEAALSLGPNGYSFHLDVTDRASFTQFIDRVEEQVGAVDVLVNNAGIMPTGRFLDESDETADSAHAVNVRGPTLGMKIVLPRMLERRRGHVVNIASMAGKVAVPYLATYCATKHAVAGLTASVLPELEDTGVSVSSVLPWIVDTRLSANVPVDELQPQTPEDVAAIVVENCDTRHLEVTVPRYFRLFVQAYNLIPKRMLPAVSKLLNAARLVDPEVREKRQEYEESCAQHASSTNN